jgi:uncharacterized protein
VIGIQPLPASAVLYDCQVSHVRRGPVRNSFRYRTCQWLIDADNPPRLAPLASFRSADHLGDPRVPIAENVRQHLAARGVDLGGGRITMLTTPRVLGLVFNPLTVYWCRAADGRLACVLAEVHNTYGERHCYLLRTDDDGRAETTKEFYVSPYYPVSGSYGMRLPQPRTRLALAISYQPPDGPAFSASITGRARPLTYLALGRMIARYQIPGAVTAARIRWQGLRLYARGLRPLPRPGIAPEKGI